MNNFWCIVTYIGATPFYYAGYYGRHSGEVELRPALTSDFNQSMKLHNREEAVRILSRMNKPEWKVEEHAYM